MAGSISFFFFFTGLVLIHWVHHFTDLRDGSLPSEGFLTHWGALMFIRIIFLNIL